MGKKKENPARRRVSHAHSRGSTRFGILHSYDIRCKIDAPSIKILRAQPNRTGREELVTSFAKNAASRERSPRYENGDNAPDVCEVRTPHGGRCDLC